MTKKFGFKSITRILYAICLLLPMFAVFGRLIYTQSNPNAKDSYTGSVSYLTTMNLNSYINQSDRTTQTEYTTNSIVHYKISNSNFSGSIESINSPVPNGDNVSGTKVVFNVDYIKFNNVVIENVKSVIIWNYNQYYSYINFCTEYYNTNYYLTNDEIQTRSIRYRNDTGDIVYSATNFRQLDTSSNFEFNNIEENIYYQVSTQSTRFVEKKIFFIESTLSNAFEYSISSFIDNNNFGNVDFFGWFTNLFLDQSNIHNALYLNFVNWYLNYSLLVSSGYLLFMVLIWFINYVRRIMDKSMNYDGGGW